MKSPAINHYLETFTNPAGRFKTLAGIEIQYDLNGSPLYTVRSKTLDVAVILQGKHGVLCCPLRNEEAFDLREYVQGHYPQNNLETLPQYFPSELLVFNSRDESFWSDVLWIETAPDILKTPLKPQRTETGNSSVLEFYEGLAIIEKSGKYGYIDREENLIVPCQYDDAHVFDEGLALVKSGEYFGLINKKGDEIFPMIHEDIHWNSDNGVVFVCDQEGKWSIKTRQNEPVSENTFDFICDFSKELASVRRENKHGYINRQGEIVIPLIYDEAYSFSEEGLATVVKNGITFCIDTEGCVFD